MKQKKNAAGKLRLLKKNDVLALRKIWRAGLVVKGIISKEESASFGAIEKVEAIFSDKTTELFGEDATILNISPDELIVVEDSLSGDSTITSLTSSVENSFKAVSPASNNAQFSATVSTCYYDNNWPQWLSAVSRGSGSVYKGGGVGRVRNDPSEWICDFVIYIPANRYTKVTGSNSAAQNVVNYSGGLSASPSKDAVIVGFNRVLLYGVPTEDWVRNFILFKK